MNRITYLRTINSIVFEKFIIFSILKKIVTFYYNTFIFQPNIFKNSKKVSTNNLEHKNSLAFLKIASDRNINYIY